MTMGQEHVKTIHNIKMTNILSHSQNVTRLSYPTTYPLVVLAANRWICYFSLASLNTVCFILNSGHSCWHQNGGCEHICIPTPTGRRCACRDGFNFVHGNKCSIPTCEFVCVITSAKSG